MDRWPPVGKHTATFEEPDIIFMKLVGPVSEAEGLEINHRHEVMAEGKDAVYYLIDLAELDSIHPAVRKAAGETLRNLPVRGAFLYRAPIKAKVAAKLIFTAMNMFKSAAEKIEILFFDSAEEARAAMARRREELARARRG